MSFVGKRGAKSFRPINHPKAEPVDAIDDRETPLHVFMRVHREFKFTIDVAAAPHNAKLPRFCTKDRSGLTISWAREAVWCNPPYSDIRPWIEKAMRERDRARVIVFLLPANRTEQSWWQDLIEPLRDVPGSGVSTRFLGGRIQFRRRTPLTRTEKLAMRGKRVKKGPRHQSPPFGNVLVIVRKGGRS